MRLLGKLLLFIIIITIAGGAWIALAGQSTKAPKAGTVIKDQKGIYSRLMAYEPRVYSDDYGTMRVYGAVKNVSQQTCNYVKFEVEVRDESNKLIKTLDVTVNDIPPGGTKSYDINGAASNDGMKLEAKAVEASFAKR